MKLSERLALMIVALIGEAKAIVDTAIKLNRTMNADEAKAVEDKHAQCAELRKQKKLAEAQEAEEAKLEAPGSRLVQDNPLGNDLAHTPHGSADAFEDFLIAPPARPKLYGRLRHATSAKEAYRFGVWILGNVGLFIPRFANDFGWAKVKSSKMWGSPQALLTEGTNTTGGYLVPEEFLNTLIDLREKYGVFRRKSKIVPMVSDRITMPRRTGGLTAYPVGEGAAGTESTKTWDRVALVATKWMALTRMTSEVNEDSVVNLGDDMMGEIAYAFAVAEDTAGFIGDGTSTYAGITGLKNALAAGAKYTQATSNTWAAQVLGDINGLMSKVPDYTVAPNPEFYCNKAYYHQVLARLAMAGGGNTAIIIRDGIAEGQFFGFAVNFVSIMPSATATTGICLYFGDLAAATKFGDRRQVAISMSDQASVGGQSMWERDEIGIKGTERFDINVHERGTATVGGAINALITG